MRILHVTRDFPPRHCGGISTAVAGLARAQVRAGLAVAVLSFDDWRPQRRATAPVAADPQTDDGIAVLRIGSPSQVAAAHTFAAAQRPDVLHVHDGMLWDFAAGLRDARGIPAVMSVHVVHRHMNTLRGAAERTRSLAAQEAALALADRILVPSRAAAALLTSPALAARLRIVGHGIDDSPAARAAAAHHAAQPACGPLLAAGRFADVKGTPELFAIVRTVLARLPGARCVIAGGIPANRRGEARWLRQWRTHTPVALQARVACPGWLDPAALATQYGEAATLIVPSRYETFGLVALEAMLHGLPVAATAAGGLAELIGHGETGLLAPPGDVEQLTEYTCALLTDAALAGRLSRQAAAAVRRERLWDHVLPKILAVYAEMR